MLCAKAVATARGVGSMYAGTVLVVATSCHVAPMAPRANARWTLGVEPIRVHRDRSVLGRASRVMRTRGGAAVVMVPRRARPAADASLCPTRLPVGGVNHVGRVARSPSDEAAARRYRHLADAIWLASQAHRIRSAESV